MADVTEWIVFQMYAGTGTNMARRILDEVRHPSNLLGAKNPRAAYAGRLKESDFQRLELVPDFREKAERYYEQGLKLGAVPLTIEMEEYPQRLRELYSPPLVLWVLGNRSFPEDMVSFGMVGTRQITPYGFEVCNAVGGELARRGAVIVSGLAAGVDAACHQAALRNHARTIGVIGTGIGKVFPASNRGLYEEILANDGTIVSEFLPGEPGTRYHFPLRNRIISGLSLGVIVVEAGRRSGSLITAGHAMTQNKPVFAVPGSIFSETSAGCNWLIQQGTIPVTSADDILQEFPDIHAVTAETSEYRQEIFDNLEAEGYNVQEEPAKPKKRPSGRKKKEEDLDTSYLSERQQVLYRLIGKTPVTSDDLAEQSGYPISQVLAAMTQLEIFGLIQTCPGRRFARV